MPAGPELAAAVFGTIFACASTLAMAAGLLVAGVRLYNWFGRKSHAPPVSVPRFLQAIKICTLPVGFNWLVGAVTFFAINDSAPKLTPEQARIMDIALAAALGVSLAILALMVRRFLGTTFGGGVLIVGSGLLVGAAVLAIIVAFVLLLILSGLIR